MLDENKKKKWLKIINSTIDATYIAENIKKFRQQEELNKMDIEFEELKKILLDIMCTAKELNQMYEIGDRGFTVEMKQILKKYEENRLEDITVDEAIKSIEDTVALFQLLDIYKDIQ